MITHNVNWRYITDEERLNQIKIVLNYKKINNVVITFNDLFKKILSKKYHSIKIYQMILNGDINDPINQMINIDNHSIPIVSKLFAESKILNFRAPHMCMKNKYIIKCINMIYSKFIIFNGIKIPITDYLDNAKWMILDNIYKHKLLPYIDISLKYQNIHVYKYNTIYLNNSFLFQSTEKLIFHTFNHHSTKIDTISQFADASKISIEDFHIDYTFSIDAHHHLLINTLFNSQIFQNIQIYQNIDSIHEIIRIIDNLTSRIHDNFKDIVISYDNLIIISIGAWILDQIKTPILLVNTNNTLYIQFKRNFDQKKLKLFEYKLKFVNFLIKNIYFDKYSTIKSTYIDIHKLILYGYKLLSEYQHSIFYKKLPYRFSNSTSIDIETIKIIEDNKHIRSVRKHIITIPINLTYFPLDYKYRYIKSYNRLSFKYAKYNIKKYDIDNIPEVKYISIENHIPFIKKLILKLYNFNIIDDTKIYFKKIYNIGSLPKKMNEDLNENTNIDRDLIKQKYNKLQLYNINIIKSEWCLKISIISKKSLFKLLLSYIVNKKTAIIVKNFLDKNINFYNDMDITDTYIKYVEEQKYELKQSRWNAYFNMTPDEKIIIDVAKSEDEKNKLIDLFINNSIIKKEPELTNLDHPEVETEYQLYYEDYEY